MTITWKAGKISRSALMAIFLGIAIPWMIGLVYLMKGVAEFIVELVK